MANEDFSRFTGEEAPTPTLPRAYEGIREDEGEDYVAGEYSTPESEAPRDEVTESESVETLPFDKPKTIVFSIVSLILSVISLLYGLSGFVGMVFGVAAIVFAIISRVHLGYFDAKSVIGLILGIVGIVFGVFIGVVELTGVFSEFDTVIEEFIGEGAGDFNHQA